VRVRTTFEPTVLGTGGGLLGLRTVLPAGDARAALGVVPQEIVADVFFTPRESLEVQAGFYGVPASERRSDELLEALGLSDKAHAYVRALSGGMKRRLMVAKALVHNPPILILDEPTAGVDVELRRQLWEYVRRLNAEGVTILLTTHYLEEAQELCDTIAIMNRGEVVACEPTPQLLRRLDGLELENAYRLLLDPLKELAGQRKVDVGFEQDAANLAQSLFDVVFGENAATTQLHEDVTEFVCELVKHRRER
jgi:ABC-type multidrug transport system ATPase subunit